MTITIAEIITKLQRKLEKYGNLPITIALQGKPTYPETDVIEEKELIFVISDEGKDVSIRNFPC